MMVINIPYGEMVVSIDDGITMAKIFARAERFREQYQGGGLQSTVHVYPLRDSLHMKIISNELYQMAKLAGEPTKD